MVRKPVNLQRQLAFPLVNAQTKRASILIIALWSLCLLTTFAVYLGYGVRQKLTLVNRLEERDKLRLFAEAGIKKAIVELKKEPEKTYFALSDNLSNSSAAFGEITIGDGVVCISLIDEERKININKVALPVLERLFKIAVDLDEIEAQELAASIIDWRDGDSELSIPLGSAEDFYYRNLSYPYEAKDAEFEILEELLLVKGVNKDIFEKIKDYITIYGSGKININTAPQAILLALGLNEELVDKIILFRNGEDEIAGTLDDNVFDAPANIVPRLSQFCSLSDSEVAQLSTIIDQYLVTNSSNFMLKSTARLNNKKNTSDTVCIANHSGKILSWQES